MDNNKLPGKIRVGIIGAGNWANYGHIPSLMLLPEYEITAVQSRRKEAAMAAVRKFGIKHVADTVEELVNHPEVDLVLVLTTAPQHQEGVRAAIAAGKDVYSEWPFTTSTKIAVELLGLANKAGVRHIMGLQRRFAPANRYLHDLIKNGYIGKLRSVRLHVSMNYFQAIRSAALKWTVPAENFSDVIAIYGGHFLDALFSVIGKPKVISTFLVNQFKEVTIAGTNERLETATNDQLALTGLLDGDAVFSVHIEGGKRNGSGVQLDITGDEGDLRVTNVSAFGGVGQHYIIEGSQGNDAPLELMEAAAAYNWIPENNLASGVTELTNLYAAYVRDVKEGTHVATTFEDGLWMHRFFDMMNESAQTGRTVNVDHV